MLLRSENQAFTSFDKDHNEVTKEKTDPLSRISPMHIPGDVSC